MLPATTDGNVGTEIRNGVGETEIAPLTIDDCRGVLESVTTMENVALPLVVATPEIVPVEGARDNPAGKVPDATAQV